MVRLTDHPDMTLDVYRGRKTKIQQQHLITMAEKHSGALILLKVHTCMQSEYLSDHPTGMYSLVRDVDFAELYMVILWY